MTSDGARALFEQAAAIARSGRPGDAVRFIEDQAESGDPDANFIVAHWLLYGSDRPRDVAAARLHMQRSADAGRTEAVRALAHLTASGAGCAPSRDEAISMLRSIERKDPIAAAEIDMARQLMGTDEAAARPVETVSDDPRIFIVRGLLNPAECAWLMRRAEPMLRPSLVDDPARGTGRPDPIRTSHGAAFVPHEADLVVDAVNRRLALATGTEAGNAEALYVMRYSPGQEYRPHLDALAGLSNQREWTAIAYLNSGFEGGATIFPELGLSLRLGAGDVLAFRNSDSKGEPDLRMRHAGEPVTVGEKWIATRWIRTGPHDPYDRG